MSRFLYHPHPKLALPCLRLTNTKSPRYSAVTSIPLSRSHLRSTTPARHIYNSTSPEQQNFQAGAPASNEPEIFYRGPLSATFRNLKLFSLTSLSLASALTPFIFIIDAPLSLSTRLGLAAAALGTSASSTALIAWCGKPYVVSMRRKPKSNAIELTTTDIFMRERRTTVLDPRFLQPTSRSFATWEIPESFTADHEPGTQRFAGSVEPIVVTCDGSGNVVGQCTVKWSEMGDHLAGVLHKQGSAIRYANR
jgi:hypothetical protein